MHTYLHVHANTPDQGKKYDTGSKGKQYSL